jgi:hypothetical protein
MTIILVFCEEPGRIDCDNPAKRRSALPKSMIQTQPSEEGVGHREQVADPVDDERIVTLPGARIASPLPSVGATHKRSGLNALYIVLARQRAAGRAQTDRIIRQAKGLDPRLRGHHRGRPTTPYRLLIEVSSRSARTDSAIPSDGDAENTAPGTEGTDRRKPARPESRATLRSSALLAGSVLGCSIGEPFGRDWAGISEADSPPTDGTLFGPAGRVREPGRALGPQPSIRTVVIR